MKRFFSSTSFWNTPIGGNPEIDPESGRILSLMRSKEDVGLWINLKRWTIPVYEVDESTPRRLVKQRLADNPVLHPFRQGACFENPVPIPGHAVPDPLRDSHIAFVDWKAKKAWDMWVARKNNEGQWESYTGMTYRVDGPGTFAPGDFKVKDGESIHFYGPSRAAGVPAIAGLIMHDEIQQGAIHHKLALATEFSAKNKFVFPPACWTDGPCENGLPEGAVIQLDPDLDLSGFTLTPGGLTVARALQKYGAVNVDTAGGTTLYGEGLYGHADKRWDAVLDEADLRPIGLQYYRVLKMENVVYKKEGESSQ